VFTCLDESILIVVVTQHILLLVYHQLNGLTILLQLITLSHNINIDGLSALLGVGVYYPIYDSNNTINYN
jgi:hypothetical protein